MGQHRLAIEDPIVVAIDRADPDDILRMADRLVGHVRTIKLGLSGFIAGGHDVVDALIDRGFDLFLDLKLHDIPHQVATACRAVTAMGVDMFTVHASGGYGMLEAAVQAARETAGEQGVPRPIVLGVTVLTSLDEPGLREVGVGRSVADQVRALVGIARDSGLDGVVCAPTEVRDVRQYVSDDFLLVTPGIRVAESALADQRRVGEPAQALADGASYIVVGRPITEAADPAEALASIRETIEVQANAGGVKG